MCKKILEMMENREHGNHDDVEVDNLHKQLSFNVIKIWQF